jgi:hypothetical protein
MAAQRKHGHAIKQLTASTKQLMHDDTELQDVYRKAMSVNTYGQDEEVRSCDAVQRVRRVMHWQRMEKLRRLSCGRLRDAGVTVSMAYVVANEQSSLHIYVRASGAEQKLEKILEEWKFIFMIDSDFHGTQQSQVEHLLHAMGCTAV